MQHGPDAYHSANVTHIQEFLLFATLIKQCVLFKKHVYRINFFLS